MWNQCHHKLISMYTRKAVVKALQHVVVHWNFILEVRQYWLVVLASLLVRLVYHLMSMAVASLLATATTTFGWLYIWVVLYGCCTLPLLSWLPYFCLSIAIFVGIHLWPTLTIWQSSGTFFHGGLINHFVSHYGRLERQRQSSSARHSKKFMRNLYRLASSFSILIPTTIHRDWSLFSGFDPCACRFTESWIWMLLRSSWAHTRADDEQ